VVRRIGKKEGVTARIVAFSPGGRRGKYATGRLKGNLRVGKTRKVETRLRARSRRRAGNRRDRAGQRRGRQRRR